MKRLPLLVALSGALALATGCAGRTAPFNEMDQAQITVLRLQPQEPPPQQAQPGVPGFPQIPGVPPEWQNMANQAMQGAQQMIPPGLIPPGLIPNQPMQPQQPPPQRFEGFIVVAQMPLTDQGLRDQILDIFGHESSFNTQAGQCFAPGMGVSMVNPNQPQGAPPVDLLISLACNQAKGNGFRWPYPENGFTPDTHDKLSKIYEKLWGPVPPGV